MGSDKNILYSLQSKMISLLERNAVILLGGYILYFLVVWVGLIFITRFFVWVNNPIPNAINQIYNWNPFMISLGILTGDWIIRKKPEWKNRYWQLVSFLFMITVINRLLQTQSPVSNYGDAGSLENFVQTGVPYPSWLIGNSVLGWAQAILWQFPPFISKLPVYFQSIQGFVLCASIITIGVGSMVLLQIWPNRLSILFPIISPFWILFGSGYSEYYPFVVVPLVAVLAYIFSKPITEHSSLTIGIIVVGMAFYYNGLIPLALILLIWYAFVCPNKIVKTIEYILLGSLIVLMVFWPGSISDYFISFYRNMNWGDLNTLWPRYAGKAAGPDSIFFSIEYALSKEHFKDIVNFFLFGGIFSSLIMIFIGIAGIIKKTSIDIRQSIRSNPNLGLAISFIIYGIFYITFMIPKLGPNRDIDLFSFVYILFSFMAGFLWDKILQNNPYHQNAKFLLTSFFMGGSIVVAYFLIQIGLPAF